MASEKPTSPQEPGLPQYILDPLHSQGPDRLEKIADYAGELAQYKRAMNAYEAEQRQADAAVDEDELENISASTDPADYKDVPDGAYITIKETKPGYRYYYWQWREGNSWKNEYIGPVDGSSE